MEGSKRDGERERRRRKKEVFKRETREEIFLSRNYEIEVRVSNPFDFGVDECSAE